MYNDQIIIKNLEELKDFSDFLKNYYVNEQFIFFSGPLGVGKTQLIKFLLADLTDSTITSPTFNLVNTYFNKKNSSITYWHFDLFNKNSISLEQMEELGLFQVWENKENKCFIEWPENLNFNLKGLWIKIDYYKENTRLIEIINNKKENNE